MKKFVACILLLLPLASFALDEDAADCQDSQVINRISGCRIYECKPREFDAAPIANGPYDAESGTDRTLSAEGRVDQITYECPKSVSPLQIVRNFENAFAAKGFKALYSGPNPKYENGKISSLQNSGQYAQVYAYNWGDLTYYEQVIVTPKELKQELVVNARYLEDEIKKHQHVAVYGIVFDVNSATIKAESVRVLSEIVKVLKDNPSWRLRIDGHTDSTGNPKANLKLSLDRANAVVKWLSKDGIPSSRLSSKGLGSTKPLASNQSEPGRAKNRRVELVKLP